MGQNIQNPCALGTLKYFVHGLTGNDVLIDHNRT